MPSVVKINGEVEALQPPDVPFSKEALIKDVNFNEFGNDKETGLISESLALAEETSNLDLNNEDTSQLLQFRNEADAISGTCTFLLEEVEQCLKEEEADKTKTTLESVGNDASGSVEDATKDGRIPETMTRCCPSPNLHRKKRPWPFTKCKIVFSNRSSPLGWHTDGENYVYYDKYEPVEHTDTDDDDGEATEVESDLDEGSMSDSSVASSLFTPVVVTVRLCLN